MARIPSNDMALTALIGKRLQIRSCHGTWVGRLTGRAALGGERKLTRTPWRIELEGGGQETFWPERCVISNLPEIVYPANDSIPDRLLEQRPA